MTFKRKSASLALVAVAVLFGACGGGGSEAADHTHGLVGEPAAAAQSDRTIEITANDPYSFSPEEVEVAAGETVLFRVTNSGESLHEFVLGPKEGHVHGEDGSNAVQVPAGETKELAWTFTEAGRVDFNCYVPGHSEAGMKGTITISS